MCISYVVYILAGEGTSMLCDMLFRVTWQHIGCDGGSQVGLFHRYIQFQDVYGLWCRVSQVVRRPGLVYPAYNPDLSSWSS